MDTNFHSGFVSLIGRPNVGKSTLMNRLVGEKIAIVTDKPQTTRNRVLSVLTREDYQIVFIDTPGIHKPKSKLGEFMVKSAETALQEVDVTLYMIEPFEKIGPGDQLIIKYLQKATNVFLVINKADTVTKAQLLPVIDAYRTLFDFTEIIPVSAARGDNIDELLQVIRQYLPVGPMYFPDDCVTDQPERQLASELIREKILQLMDDEIPHGIAVEIMSMKARKSKDLVDIEANIYCEKDSHKGMIIGKGGAKLKDIGARARLDIERLLGSRVNLQLWVKVKKDWRDSDFLLRSFGFKDI